MERLFLLLIRCAHRSFFLFTNNFCHSHNSAALKYSPHMKRRWAPVICRSIEKLQRMCREHIIYLIKFLFSVCSGCLLSLSLVMSSS